MNHAFFVVKIIGNPVHLIHNECQSIEIKVKVSTPRKKSSRKELTLVLWGDSFLSFLKYYKIQDYLIIEGIVTLKGYINEDNEVKVIVKRLYPFLLN
uniref:hypothetical protein n=1 Tax=Halosiphon tomentosus TaxID=64927 RepID=UPI002E75BE6C|nr:hypothetical protein V2488_pgp011 [Halosiphon tomentosus]WAM63810.1 hypothetical protein [Halosiphon tomentosus]